MCLLGCSRPQGAYFPIQPDAKWIYAIRSGLLSRVEDVKVTRTLSVAGVQGYELGGAMGYSRVAIKGDVVVAENLCGTTYSPPLPLLVLKPEEQTRNWSGIVSAGGRSMEATAILVQKPGKTMLGGRGVRSIECELSIHLATKRIDLRSTYAYGLGLVRQEQHENRAQQRYLEYLSGP